MLPRLVALSGPSQGIVWELTQPSFSIGRDAANNAFLDDTLVSRRHCTLEIKNGEAHLVDLESLNGTFVNDQPVKNCLLEHGDRIEIGESVLVFMFSEKQESKGIDIIEIENGDSTVRATTGLRLEDTMYLQAGRIAAKLPAAKIAKDLQLLLELSTQLTSAKSVGELLNQLLDSMHDGLNARRGAAILIDEVGGFKVMAKRDIASAPGVPFQVDRFVINQAMDQNGVCLITGSQDEKNSILCVPLKTKNLILALIYLEFSNAENDENLQLAAAIGSIASLAIENLKRHERLQEENQRLVREVVDASFILGESPAIKNVIKTIAKLAPTDTTVLITGESGTGKELVARAIHRQSPRSAGPLIAINCAALTESLLESELFGHEKGAFTGAVAQMKGRFEMAHTGTVFLDEVGELTSLIQAKLLRVLQDHTFERIGGRQPIQVDIRLIAATNRDLNKAVRDGSFREDLFYRLNVLNLRVPPLRERKEDIFLLANHFVRKYAAKLSRHVAGISPEARSYLISHDWPGNVRELENAIERAVVLGTASQILLEDLPDSLTEISPPGNIDATVYYQALQQAKIHIILKALEQTEGNITQAARSLGLQRTYLHRLMRRLGLSGIE